MKLAQIVSVIAMAAALSACKTVETPDGKIPAEYIGVAKTLEGAYLGQFDKMPSELSFKMEGDTPVLTYTDIFGHDLIGRNCGSSIGKLKEVTLSDETPPTIEMATFELNPGHCSFDSPTIDVAVSIHGNDVKLDLSAVRSQSQMYVPGQVVCHPDNQGHPVCFEGQGHYETHYNYANGSFTKVLN